MKYSTPLTLLATALLAKLAHSAGADCDYHRPGITLNCAQPSLADVGCDLVVIGADGGKLCDTGPDKVVGDCCTTPGGHEACIDDLQSSTSGKGDPKIREDGVVTHHVDSKDCSSGLSACECWYYDTVNWT